MVYHNTSCQCCDQHLRDVMPQQEMPVICAAIASCHLCHHYLVVAITSCHICHHHLVVLITCCCYLCLHYLIVAITVTNVTTAISRRTLTIIISVWWLLTSLSSLLPILMPTWAEACSSSSGSSNPPSLMTYCRWEVSRVAAGHLGHIYGFSQLKYGPSWSKTTFYEGHFIRAIVTTSYWFSPHNTLNEVVNLVYWGS